MWRRRHVAPPLTNWHYYNRLATALNDYSGVISFNGEVHSPHSCNFDFNGFSKQVCTLVVCEVPNFLKTSKLQPDQTSRDREKAELAEDKSFGNASCAVPPFPPRMKTNSVTSDLSQEHFLIPSRLFSGSRRWGGFTEVSSSLVIRFVFLSPII